MVFLDEAEIKAKFYARSSFSMGEFLDKNISLSLNYGLTSANRFLVKYFCDNFGLNGTEAYFGFHDKTFFAKFYIKCRDFTLVEDGLVNYTSTKVIGGPLKKSLRYCLGYHPNIQIMGEAKCIKNIVLFEKKMVPKSIETKCDRINIQKTLKDQDFVDFCNSVFCFHTSKNAYTTFLTQGVDVAGLCSTEQKLTLYGNLCRFIVNKTGQKLVVKPHPSEEEDVYEKLFDEDANILIADAKVPFEIYALNDAQNSRYLSLQTSGFGGLIRSDLSSLNLIDDVNEWKNFDVSKIEFIAKSKANDVL